MEIDGLGTDFNSNWEFSDGDLVLVSSKNNLIQSIINRFNTKLNSLDLFYTEYGSNIYAFLGWVHSEDTLEFIELEINDTLEQDPRCTDFSVNVSYYKQKIIAEITIYFDDDADLTFNLVINEYGKINLVNNRNEIEEEEEE